MVLNTQSVHLLSTIASKRRRKQSREHILAVRETIGIDDIVNQMVSTSIGQINCKIDVKPNLSLLCGMFKDFSGNKLSV